MFDRARRAPADARFRRMVPLFVLLAVAMLLPPAAAATTYTKTARCDNAAVRAKPSVTARKVRSIDVGARVVVTAKLVDGGRWSVRCGGSRSGRAWYRITAINGTSVRSKYGVAYLYAARGTLKASTETRYAACDGVTLRTRTSTSSASKATIGARTRVTISGTMTNRGAWTTRCAGTTRTGKSWYRVDAVDGIGVRKRFGVDHVYVATSLLASTAPVAKPAAAEAPTPTPAPTAPPPTAASPYLEGIDVSHWQNTIDWTAVSAAGKKFAFIKASESTDYVDPLYQANRGAAKANGLVVGAYHFARPDAGSNDAVLEADHFVDTAGPVAGELLPVLDLEVSGGLTRTALQAWVRAFLDHVYDRTGQRGIIYVSPSFWQNSMGNTTSFATGGYKVLWVAHWTTASAPSVPASSWGGNGWTLWQYSSSGSAPGIAGRVDLDRFNGTDLSRIRIH